MNYVSFEQLYRVLDFASTGMCVVDSELQVVFWNRCLERWTELAREDVLGASLTEMYESLLQPKYHERLVDVLAGGPPAVFSAQLHKHFFPVQFSDGKLRVQHTVVSSIQWEDGEKHALINIQDVTELADSVTDLRDVRDLAVRRQKLAEQATEAKGKFLASMSHELRTPLHGVIGSLDLAQETELRAERDEFLGIAKSSARHMLTLVSDLLDFSQIEAGELKIRPIAVKLSQEVDQAIRPLRVLAEQKEITFSITLDERIPELISIDGLRLIQILINLVSNSIKFTESSGTVEVHFERTDGLRKPTLEMRVSDTGIGMTEEALKRIFSPFAQAEESTTRRFGGTGLGLSIVSNLVELMDGKISVKSTVGKGSEFIVELPLIHATGAQLALLEEQESAPADGEVEQSLKVLLAEDNVMNQRIAARVLEKAGHEVVLAADGHEAVARYKDSDVDIILMDWHMPIMDGLDAMRAIRELELKRASHTPIIAFTATSSAQDIQTCVEAGADGCVSKPFDRKELLRALTRLTNR